MRRFLVTFLASTLALFIFFGMFFGILFGIEKLHRFQTETDFVILVDKVGHPAFMTTFRVNPNRPENKNPDYCSVGGDTLYTPHNVSVFTAAQVGDVLKRYHYTNSYRIFSKTFWQDCFEMYMPVKLVSIYPDMGHWPFRKDDLRKGDPDYDRIMRLTQSQR